MGGKRSSSSRTSAAEVIAGNDNLLTESILLRLPAKVLVRFQLVCKHWQSLIFSPWFSRFHMLRHRRRLNHHTTSGVYVTNPSETDVFYFSPALYSFCKVQLNDRPYTSTRIRQHCNGLLLLALDGGRSYSVSNPTTKQSSVLKLRRRGDDDRICSLFLGFDPSRSMYYKVVFVYNVDDRRPHVATYDSETGEWTSIYPLSSGDRVDRPPLCDAVCWNNKLYWITHNRGGFCSYLDLQAGNYGSIPSVMKTSPAKPGEYSNYSLNQSNGRLHCFENVKFRGFPTSICVFELMEDNSGWLQLYTTDLSRILSEFPQEIYSEVRVIGFVRPGADSTEEHVLLLVSGRVILYRFSDGSHEVVLCETYIKRDLRERFSFRRNIFPCIETLAPV